MIGSVYRRYIKNNLFMKLLLSFALITILTIITLSYMMYHVMSQSVVQREMDNQKKAMESVNAFLSEKYESVQSMVLGVYRDPRLAADISYFLQHDFRDYIEHGLNRYYEEDVAPYGLSYFANRIEDDTDIRNLMLYSAEKQSLYVYNRQKSAKLHITNAVHSYVPDAMALDNKNVSVPNPWIRKEIDQWDPRLFAVRAVMNDKNSLKYIGQLLIYFDSDGIWKSLASYKETLKGTILVLTPDGNVIFDSSGTYYGKSYPYMNQIQQETGMLEQESYITTLAQNQAGYVVVGAIPKQEIAAASQGWKRTILIASVLGILIAILFPSLVVINFAKRTNKIIRFMKKVETGDLTSRIIEPKEDELGQISRSFNDMLDELNRYIERVYKAEIRQKHTEFAALQARVNPHFLYNTLEVIRMRAISQGAHDVGEMIFSLSALFRNVVQQKAVYTLKDELEACRLYLELFRIRYKDRFTYAIECDRELYGIPVVKMFLQPIIENYIVHGIEADRDDNRAVIRFSRENGTIRVRVEDNGRGIEPQRLEEIKQALGAPEEVGGSFGLRVVYERLKLLHGNRAGMELKSKPGAGTTVTVWFPEKEGAGESDV
ncbi:sensor histidine kinase [Paenibacillus tyrfis]|uniref:sensor histidine kinase n=1 Tax=Paenibacillus tyrfis TaxID=1501230 RepID=UPI0020A14278|nr:sensor histidine kinase [Paenibacillus tyrfis]MCP1310879.1 sensor histidine kinase [Paenibacillus tyrfis]